jgi:NAD+ kinase
LKKQPEKIHRIGLVANASKPDGCAALRRAAALLVRHGCIAAVEESAAQQAGLKCPVFPSAAALARHSDLLLVFGGDGTILRAVREAGGCQTPILGINVGRLGFLNAVAAADLPGALQKLWAGDFVIERRPLLAATVRCAGQKTLKSCALNDIVISHGAVSRVIELEVGINGETLTNYRGDGLIVSSPTGSTAYSLSAGGPIIHPAAQVFAITPICPHALSNRSVIVDSRATVEVKVLSEQMQILVAADGQMQATVGCGDVVTVRRAVRPVRLLHLGGWSFFDTVRRKLHWSGTSV